MSDHLKYKFRSDLCGNDIESIWIELYPGSKWSMLFGCVYRPPSTHAQTFFDSLVLECDFMLEAGRQNLTIMGDFNADLLKPSLSQTTLLLEFCKGLDLDILETNPTRITENSISTIDLFATNNSSCFRDTVSCPFSGSDHNIISTSFVARGIKMMRPPRYIKIRKYQNITDDIISKAVECADVWDEVLELSNIDDCIECFNLVLLDLFYLLCPAKWIRVRENSPVWCLSRYSTHTYVTRQSTSLGY